MTTRRLYAADYGVSFNGGNSYSAFAAAVADSADAELVLENGVIQLEYPESGGEISFPENFTLLGMGALIKLVFPETSQGYRTAFATGGRNTALKNLRALIQHPNLSATAAGKVAGGVSFIAQKHNALRLEDFEIDGGVSVFEGRRTYHAFTVTFSNDSTKGTYLHRFKSKNVSRNLLKSNGAVSATETIRVSKFTSERCFSNDFDFNTVAGTMRDIVVSDGVICADPPLGLYAETEVQDNFGITFAGAEDFKVSDVEFVGAPRACIHIEAGCKRGQVSHCRTRGAVKKFIELVENDLTGSVEFPSAIQITNNILSTDAADAVGVDLQANTSFTTRPADFITITANTLTGFDTQISDGSEFGGGSVLVKNNIGDGTIFSYIAHEGIAGNIIRNGDRPALATLKGGIFGHNTVELGSGPLIEIRQSNKVAGFSGVTVRTRDASFPAANSRFDFLPCGADTCVDGTLSFSALCNNGVIVRGYSVKWDGVSASASDKYNKSRGQLGGGLAHPGGVGADLCQTHFSPRVYNGGSAAAGFLEATFVGTFISVR